MPIEFLSYFIKHITNEICFIINIQRKTIILSSHIFLCQCNVPRVSDYFIENISIDRHINIILPRLVFVESLHIASYFLRIIFLY